ncbi:MAG: hypothetical protein ABI664_11795 [bacterium]
MTYIESEPTARPAMVALAANDLILRGDLDIHPPSEAEGVAALIAEKIADVIRDGSAPPSIVRVRHSAVADALRGPLKALGVPSVMDTPSLPMLEGFLEGMRKHMTGLDRVTGAMSQPATWAGWGFAPEILSAVLDAAATFHAAQPWLIFSDADTVRIESPTGSVWYACILGKGGQTFGLALYEKIEELTELLRSESGVDAFAYNNGAVVTLNFDPRSDIAPPLRKELTKTKRYPVGSQAYPWLWTLNTIGGGLSAAYARDLVNALESLPRFSQWADEIRRGSSGDQVMTWTDERTGTVLALMDVFFDRPPLWTAPIRFTTALPEGDDADPRALFDVDSTDPIMAEDMLRFARFIGAEHAAGAPTSRISGDAMALDLFVTMVNNELGIRLRALTERDLRAFLYDIFPRKVMFAGNIARGLRASLRRFFTWMEENDRLSYPWARSILRDRQAFDERVRRFPGGNWWDPAVILWINELTYDLVDRLMEPAPDCVGVGEWGAEMGPEEARLHAQLLREWMIWRDEFIRRGLERVDHLATVLLARQQQWELAPQKELKGKSPSEVVKRERKRRPPTGDRPPHQM